MKKRVLIVDNCLRLWNELANEFGTTIDKKFISDKESTEIYKQGFVQLENSDMELYITAELQTGKKLIETQTFDVYFLDNQLYDTYTSQKILGQKELIDMIKNKNLDVFQSIYNISSHENTNGLNKCPKKGKYIMATIMSGNHEKRD